MWERLQEKRNDGGFTLIELLIVIIILAILAAIVIFAVGNTSTSAKQAACNSDAKTVETALEAYKAQVGVYPTTFTELTGTTTVNGVTVGPWLRQAPSAVTTINGYAISLSGTTDGVVDVQTNAGATVSNYDTTPNVCNTIS